MFSGHMDKMYIRRDQHMGNPKKDHKHFTPSHVGTQPRGFSGNKGKKMNDTSGQHAQVIQTKGE
jgi:small acid-soluble spore protein N (minor)